LRSEPILALMCPHTISEPLPPAPNDVAGDLQEAARAFFPELIDVQAVPGHPNLAHISTPAASWRVHRWPGGTPSRDVTFSHAVIHTARQAGLAVAPEVAGVASAGAESVQQFGVHLYDAWQWRPGSPVPRADAAWPDAEVRIDLPAVLSPSAFAQVMSQLAHLHAATQPMSTVGDAPVAPLEMLPGAVEQAQARHRQNLRARARHEPALQRWLSTGERLIAVAEPLVTAAHDEQALPQTVLHLGLWPGHVLFEQEQLTGLLGWERVAIGSPLLDIAQAIVRLQGWSDEAVEMAIASYSDVRTLSPSERRLLPAVAALDAVAATGRLLEQTYSRAAAGRPPTAVRAAIDLMLTSLTSLEHNLSALETVGKSRRTPWRRSPRPAPREDGGKRHVRRRRTT
jgi:aminoglycoside phosphotransferase (APT) family kinase protein